MKILITGMAGFIGFHLAKVLSENGSTVIGIDNINDYYNTEYKLDRLAELGFCKKDIKDNKLVLSKLRDNLSFIKISMENYNDLFKLFSEMQFDCVCHLAAQAGVRYGIKKPKAYLDSNLISFFNLMEACRHNQIKHLIFASSSSVYGLNKTIPFSIHSNTDHPISLYAATKKSNEMLAHSYSHLYGIPTTGLRFFTVYGPWGRPDMAIYKFVSAIKSGHKIDVFNYGKLKRDFTYIDDIINGIMELIAKPPTTTPDWDAECSDPATSSDPFRLYNIGRGEAVPLLDFISNIENIIGRKAQLNMCPMQPGDVLETWADTSSLKEEIGYKPKVSIEEGVMKYVDWYNEYYKD